MKLRTKLMLIAAVIVVFAVFISTFLVITFSKQNTVSTIISKGTADFEEFCRNFLNSMPYTNANKTDRSLYSDLRYRFYNTSGREEFVLQKDDAFISNNTGIDAVKALEAHSISETNIAYPGTTLRHTLCRINGKDYYVASAGIDINQQTYTLSFVRNITSTMDEVNRLGIKCALMGAAVAIAAAMLMLFFVRRSLIPVRVLERKAVEISDGRYDSRIHIKGHDEIASLAERFNRMAEAVSERIAALNETAERQKAFINALSHEIKTPVTSIMARAETLLLRDVSERDRERSLERIYNQCAWMEKLSGKLTALVMLQGSVDVKPENVGELLAAVEETVSDALEKKNITIITDCRIGVLSVDFDLMRSALVNLVDNAVKASEKDAVIELRAYNNILEVEDHGRGIPEEEIGLITQPFYVADRSRNKKTGGSGLGLALVQRITEVHGAELIITSKLGEGTTVKIIFPGDVDK